MSGHKKKTVHIPKPCRDYAKKFEDQTLIHEVNDRIEQKLSQILTEQKLYYREGQNFYSLDGSYFTRIRPENERILTAICCYTLHKPCYASTYSATIAFNYFGTADRT